MKIKKFLVLFSFSIIFSCFPVFAKVKYYYICVEEIDSKEKPSFWGTELDSFFYGEKIEALEWKGSWVKIKGHSGKSGWVKDSAITSKKIVVRKQMDFDADELALAGKGFSQEIEAEYGVEYNIDFEKVDEMENVEFTRDEIKDFIEAGKLRSGE